MDSIEPVRPSPLAIAPIDATHVRLGAGEREESAQQRRRRERERRGGSDVQAAGEELPSVVIDADLLDGSRARDAAEHEAAEHEAADLDAPEQEPFAEQQSRERELPSDDDGSSGGGGGGRGHVDLTV